jgi:tRNA U34 5-methylaminomethyl-2-thiouridine-forming methyltransferase MnmC
MQEVKRTIITTTDGSQTVEIPDLEVTYHSRWGAQQESVHVFIDAGFRYMVNREDRPHPLRIFEMGLGTGLNALLTLIEAGREKVAIHYTSIEPFPLEPKEWTMLNYGEGQEQKQWFRQIHEVPWGEDVAISDHFTFRKEQKELDHYSPAQPFHLIYFDAFAPKAQPQLWTQEVFEQLYGMLHLGGALVTYCSKSVVRRAMQAAGLSVQKIPGPKWKREMLRATKPEHTASQ